MKSIFEQLGFFIVTLISICLTISFIFAPLRNGKLYEKTVVQIDGPQASYLEKEITPEDIYFYMIGKELELGEEFDIDKYINECKENNKNLVYTASGKPYRTMLKSQCFIWIKDIYGEYYAKDLTDYIIPILPEGSTKYVDTSVPGKYVVDFLLQWEGAVEKTSAVFIVKEKASIEYNIKANILLSDGENAQMCTVELLKDGVVCGTYLTKENSSIDITTYGEEGTYKLKLYSNGKTYSYNITLSTESNIDLNTITMGKEN